MSQDLFAGTRSEASLRLEHDTTVAPGPFECSGLASLEDLNSPRWRTLFSELEGIQEEFLSVQPHFEEYKWPVDPLHNCTRVWEYPFVWSNIKRWLTSQHFGNTPRILDVGSGVTFFPFAIARLGCDVVALDVDPACKASFIRARQSIGVGDGSVEMVISDATGMPLIDSSVDCIYCISVIEHVADFKLLVDEMARVLHPRGLLLVTFDVDLRGNFAIGPAAYGRLRLKLNEHFNAVLPERVVHPLAVLTSDNSPYPFYGSLRGWRAWQQAAKKLVRPFWRLATGRRPLLLDDPLLVTTFGAVLQKAASQCR